MTGEAGILAVLHVELEHRPEPDHALREAEPVLVRHLKVEAVPTSPNVSFTCHALTATLRAGTPVPQGKNCNVLVIFTHFSPIVR